MQLTTSSLIELLPPRFTNFKFDNFENSSTSLVLSDDSSGQCCREIASKLQQLEIISNRSFDSCGFLVRRIYLFKDNDFRDREWACSIFSTSGDWTAPRESNVSFSKYLRFASASTPSPVTFGHSINSTTLNSWQLSTRADMALSDNLTAYSSLTFCKF